jgi:Family of unknown function (DUF6492)
VSELAVLTPSYAPDLELCRDLNRSVLELMAPEVCHHVVVPRHHRDVFASLEGPRTRVWSVDEFLPRSMVPIPVANLWINLHRPYPPVRGWITQQLVKLRATEELGAEVVLLADSDVRLVRPAGPDTFSVDGQVRFYRKADAVDERLPRHRVWHAVARRLLGLPPAASGPLPDYISAFNVWERRIVQMLRDRVESVTGRPWLEAIGSQLHVSEFMLYGVFVDEVLGAEADVFATDSMLCHSYWDLSPLEHEAAVEFVAAADPDDVAVMISAKSRTPLAVRREALSRLPAPATLGAPSDA